MVDVEASKKTNQELFSEILASGNGKVLLEELIVQTDDIASFNPSSVNTVRCVTFYTKEGLKIFPHSFFRTGRKGSIVDNGGAGGVFAGIDDETGIINTCGYDELGRTFTAHPDSNVVYKGFQIPEYQQMKDLCLELGKMVLKLKYCSWDMAHTERGWVLVEGNPNGQMVAQQICACHSLKSEFEAMVRETDTLA